ncbi:MAG: hypothetical protein LBH14_07695 [Desulfobulbaceae bacterium]|jgi:acyl dehydratase|nr:hypothetical protein [Desulfobulbaceae bacterium]
MEKLYIDDLHPGDTFESGEYLVTATDIKTFAQQFDPQVFHLDEVAAEASFFHGLATSGAHGGYYDAFAGGKRAAGRRSYWCEC